VRTNSRKPDIAASNSPDSGSSQLSSLRRYASSWLRNQSTRVDRGRDSTVRAGGDIHISEPRTVVADGVTRVSATVDGEELFFESPDMHLSAVPEAFASAMLPVAVNRNRRLVLSSPLDRRWLHNVEGVLATWNAWWGTPARLSDVLSAPRRNAHRRIAGAPARGVGLCFSLGVDSFHTLLRSGREIDHLLLAEGFDIRLDDGPRVVAAEASLREVAGAMGVRAVMVRTNLRDHPSSGRRMRWALRVHGGALAALGHACSAEIGELLISSTKPHSADAPWGSHWETDRGWSSSRLLVTHLGAQWRRNEKLAAIMDEPLVRRHLRVCWENRAPVGNCGECEKCLRTILILSVHGRIDAFTTFPANGSLAARLDAVKRIHPASGPVYEATLPGIDDPELRGAVERLLERSGAPAPTAPRR
jgi:hypothetical protein